MLTGSQNSRRQMALARFGDNSRVLKWIFERVTRCWQAGHSIGYIINRAVGRTGLDVSDDV